MNLNKVQTFVRIFKEDGDATATGLLTQKEVPPELSRPHLCPSLLQLAEVCLTLPVSNAWPERAASAIKRLKTRQRSNLKNDMLRSLLHITVNGPDSSDCHHVIEEAMKEWLSKPRRKISKYTDKQKEVAKHVTVDNASVQVESQSDLERIHSAYMNTLKRIFKKM
ncbi:Zinc finger 862 [Paramuricea clavata]|uniref:Zinc finger 862 n=1 Tax=Paramuricea clavata TaxID=317549 RepID=A0A6S7JJL3_PARCT|nr:Zinc finger 862 [Paramuricea clavata]